jgi:ABC-type polysaccharide/polyol phosphate transport system ATPase subunit
MSTIVPPAIHVDGVSKTFEIPREHVHTLKEKALHPLRRSGHDTLRALRDVSFTVDRGEFFGIVGRNGSGKSTLLKCLAGIYGVDQGRIYVNGRVSTFIELGVGFNPDLAAYDNVMLNATMLGLSTREARKRFDHIIDFAELHEFTDLKLKNYSSGMLVRLAFSVMIQVDADILLIDEVLAVGDAAFQQKCFDEFGRIRQSGATVLLVTHDMGAVQRFCDRALLLERGRKVELADTERVADQYLELNFSHKARADEALQAAEEDAAAATLATTVAEAEPASAQEAEPASAQEAEPASAPEAEPADEPDHDGAAPAEHGVEPFRVGDRRAEVLEAWFEDRDGNRSGVLRVGERCAFCARVRFNDRLEDPLFGINVYNSLGDMVWAANNKYEAAAGVFDAGEEIVFRIAFDNVLAPDRYAVTPAIARDANGLTWHDRRHRLISAMVTGTRPRDGLIALPFDFGVDRMPADVTVERVIG